MIELIGAILARDANEVDQGTSSLSVPFPPIDIPSDQRDRGEIEIVLPEITAYIALRGGAPKEAFTWSWSALYPHGLGGTLLKTIEAVWHEHSSVHQLALTIPDGGRLPFIDSGTYDFRFLLNGQPLVTLPLYMAWRDEIFPDGS